MAPPKPAHIETLLNVLEAIRVAREDLTITQVEAFLTLIHLTGADEKDVRQDDIGDRLGRPQGVVSKQLSRLVIAGLITKDISPLSEREKTYKVTPKGKSLIQKMTRIFEG